MGYQLKLISSSHYLCRLPKQMQQTRKKNRMTKWAYSFGSGFDVGIRFMMRVLQLTAGKG